jgi:hypothetical protein
VFLYGGGGFLVLIVIGLYLRRFKGPEDIGAVAPSVLTRINAEADELH